MTTYTKLKKENDLLRDFLDDVTGVLNHGWDSPTLRDDVNDLVYRVKAALFDLSHE